MNSSIRNNPYKKYRVALILVLCVAVIIINPYKIFLPFHNVLSTILMPVQKIAYATSYNIRSFGRFVGTIGELKSTNEILRGQNQSLVARVALLEDLQKENTLLREQFRLDARDQYALVNAQIIARDSIHAGTWIDVNRGTRNGVAVGMAVIVSDSILIGRVDEVFATTARVRLLTHPQSTLSGVIVQTQTRGVVRGSHGLTVIFDDVLQKDLVNIGDMVVNEDIDDLLPRGLFVGTVQDVMSTQNGLFQKATLVPLIDFSTVRFVSIITQVL